MPKIVWNGRWKLETKRSRKENWFIFKWRRRKCCVKLGQLLWCNKLSINENFEIQMNKSLIFCLAFTCKQSDDVWLDCRNQMGNAHLSWEFQHKTNRNKPQQQHNNSISWLTKWARPVVFESWSVMADDESETRQSYCNKFSCANNNTHDTQDWEKKTWIFQRRPCRYSFT